MNILVVSHFGLYEDLTFSYVHNQAREYAALGHTVRVILPNGVGKTGPDGGRFFPRLSRRKVDGVELFDLRYLTLSRFGEKRFNTASAIFGVQSCWKEIFDDFRPDVIQAHTLGFDAGIGIWLKEKLGCPLVITTHGSDTARPLENGQADLLREQCDRADTVVAVSGALRGRLAQCGTAAPIKVIHNGFVVRPIPVEIPRDPYALIQVGNLVKSKRVDVTIRAFSLLRRQYPLMRLTVVGDGPEREKLESLCASLGVEEWVHFTGKLHNQAVFQHLCRAGFFIMASKPEGFGIAYLEAMNAQCVTVGTEGQGIADLIRHGVNGFLVPADDPEAIARIVDECLAHPGYTEQIARRGGESARELTWRKNAERYTELFQQLCKAK